MLCYDIKEVGGCKTTGFKSTISAFNVVQLIWLEEQTQEGKRAMFQQLHVSALELLFQRPKEGSREQESVRGAGIHTSARLRGQSDWPSACCFL